MCAFRVFIVSVLVVAAFAAPEQGHGGPPPRGPGGPDHQLQNILESIKTTFRKIRSVQEIMHKIKENPAAMLSLSAKNLGKEMREELETAIHTMKMKNREKRSQEFLRDSTLEKVNDYLKTLNPLKNINKRSMSMFKKMHQKLFKRSINVDNMKQVSEKLRSMAMSMKSALASKK